MLDGPCQRKPLKKELRKSDERLSFYYCVKSSKINVVLEFARINIL